MDRLEFHSSRITTVNSVIANKASNKTLNANTASRFITLGLICGGWQRVSVRKAPARAANFRYT